MKRIIMLTLIIAVISFLFCSLAEAKRGPAPEVEPVTYKGIKFIAPNTPQRMGYVEAWDIKKNIKVWEQKMYDIAINPIMESDVQWLFISSLKIRNDKLIVTEEKGKYYEVYIPKSILEGEEQLLTLANIPHKDCLHLLQSYYELVQTEKDAKNLLNNWINAEYTKEEIGIVEIDQVLREANSYFLVLTTALPQKENHPGYKYYKITNGQIFGLYCSK